MNDASLAIDAKLQRLQEEIGLLREDLTLRLAELHDLEHTEKPHLLAIFQTKLGPWELRLLKARCNVARWKRKSELIQADINRGQTPELKKIDDALEEELLTWHQKLKEAAKKINLAQFRLDHLMEPEDASELKKQFRELAKKLHPDVNPDLDEALRVLWLQVLAAYESSDLQKIKALALIVESKAPLESLGPRAKSAIKSLQIEHERLRTTLERIYQQLAAIQKQAPFSSRAQWEDAAWLKQRRSDLETQEALALEEAAALEKHVKTLLLFYGTGQQSNFN